MKKRIIIVVIILLAFIIADRSINLIMMHGTERYFGLHGQPGLLLIGHSHLMLATDKKRLEKETGMSVAKYCREGVNVSDKHVMVDHFLNSGHADSLRIVLYGVDLATFIGSGLSANSYKLLYPFLDNEHVDAYVRSQAASPTDYWLHKLVKSTRFNDDGIKNSALRGWAGNWDNFKNNVINIEAYRRRLEAGDERHIQMNPELMAEFTETIETLTDRGIRVILVNTPTVDLLNDFEPDKYSAVMQWYSDFADQRPLVEFWDFNPEYASDHSIFSDRLHLNRHGQQIITDEMIKKLKE